MPTGLCMHAWKCRLNSDSDTHTYICSDGGGVFGRTVNNEQCRYSLRIFVARSMEFVMHSMVPSDLLPPQLKYHRQFFFYGNNIFWEGT